MRTFYLIILLIAGIVIRLHAQGPDITGFARTYEGVLYDKGSFGIIQQTLNLSFDKMGSKGAFKANPMIFLYDTDSIDFRLRELYLDLFFDRFDVRIGKQQVVWGKADGVFITDIISPLNLSEFLLPDFDEIRQGIIATKINYYIGNSTIEAIWVPVFAPTEYPQPGSIWYIQPQFPVFPMYDNSKKPVDPSLENSELFLKFTTLSSAIDFEVMGAYTWDDDPTLYTQKVMGIDSSTMSPVLTELNITPEHNRLAIGGGSFSADVKGVILRGEGALYKGKTFATADPHVDDGIVERNYLHYLLGVDFSIGSVDFSMQFIQETILDYNDLMMQKQTENTMTFLARYDMFRETLKFELFSYIGLTNEDALVRPKITYDFEDGFSILLGSNIFVGNEEGRFGRYLDNSMIYTKIRYNF